MSFGAPLGLLALLSLPAILALHLFRRRFRERRIAGLFLFAPEGLRSEAGRRRTRLLRTVSLWLELLAGLLLALWLAQPVLGERTGPGHVVVVLDDSASMGARSADGTAADRARAAVEGLLADLTADGVVTIVLTGPRPEILAGPRAPRDHARARLAGWRPERIAHDPSPALEIGLDLAGKSDRLCWVTDRSSAAPPERYRHVAVGDPTTNAAVVSARRTRRGETEQVFVDLSAWGPGPHETRVRLSAGDRIVAEREVTIVPGRTTRLTFTVPASPVPLIARLGPDGLAIDDEVLLLPTPRRTVAVYEALGPKADLTLRTRKVLSVLPDVRTVSEARNARLVLTPVLGAAPRGATEILVLAAGEKRDDWIGPFLLERRHSLGGGAGPALLAGMTLEGVIWSAGRTVPPGRPLVTAGEAVLLSEEVLPDEGVRLHLNLDPARSNLGSSPDWPIFLDNAVEQTRAKMPGPVAVNVRAGGEIEYRFSGVREDVTNLSLVDPRDVRRPARGYRRLTWEARRPGLHRLVRGDSEVCRYAVNFVDPAESDLTGCDRIDVLPVEAPAVSEADLASGGLIESRVLAVLLLLVIAADWFVLKGRR